MLRTLSCLAPTYMPSFPSYPTIASGNDTGYDLVRDDNGRIKVFAPGAELGESITVTR